MKPALKAHRWDTCLALALVIGAVGYLNQAAFVPLPFLQDMVPVRLLIAIVAVVSAITPLYPAFTSLAPSLVREARNQRLRPVGTVALAMVGYAPCAAGVKAAAPDTLFFLALLAAALVSVAVAGYLAWAIVLALGFTALMVDSAPGAPLTRLLESCTGLGLAGATMGATMVVAHFGTRQWRNLA